MRVELALLVCFSAAAVGIAHGKEVNAPGPCLKYRPMVVELTGQLIERKYWGPPGYGEDPKVDSLETAILLLLDRPICVEGDPSSDLNTSGEWNQVLVQLGPFEVTWKELQTLKGKHIRVTGVLDHAITGHHRTPVLLSVKSASAA